MAELIFPLSFKRQYGGSLDPDLVFETIVDRDTYLTNPLRYAGQIVACKELEGKIFVLNNAMDKWLSQESADSCKVKISNDDITEDFLENKIVGTTDKISITKQNTGENETLIINVSTDVFDKTVDNTENITETENKVFVSPTEKTAITHINRDDLDLVSGTNTGDETKDTIKTKLGTDLSNKVDKVTGKSLISDEEITRLSTVINYDDTAIQSHISDITIHVTSTEKETWNNKSDFDGAYSSLTDSPTIPSKTSDLTNDNGFLTSIPDEYINETELTTALTPYAKTADIPDVSNKLEVTNLIQGTNITLAKNGNDVTINATGGGTSAVYTGATDLLDGAEGLVVKPLIADKDKYLKGDGTWSVITGTGTSDYNALNNKPTTFIGATSETNGVMGFVPTPTTTDINKYLSSNGGWESIAIPTIDTVLNVSSTNAISNSAVTAAFNALTNGVQDYIGYFADLTARNAYSGTVNNGDWCTVAVDSNYSNNTTNYIYNSTTSSWTYNGTVSTTQIVIDDTATIGDNDVVFSADKTLALLATKPNMSIILEVSTSTSWVLSDNGNYYYQSIPVSGITADRTKTKIDVSISDTHTEVQYLTACNAMLNPIGQTENAFTLACYGTKPTITIPLTIVVEQVVGA